jgi:hypothetical protein
LQVEELETRALLSTTGLDGLAAQPVAPLPTSNSVPSIQPDAVAPAYSANQSPAGYWPDQIRHAYGFDKLTLDGSGQTIAIVDAYHDPNIFSDLDTFDHQFPAAFGSTPTPAASFLTQVDQSGGTVDSGWALEISLDVEWAHSVAPKANILLVEAASSNLQDLLTAVDTARNTAGVVAVSMSWGAGEFSGETSYDGHFTSPTGRGVTFTASSGDSGAQFGLDWPAASSNVLSVGGTTLSLNADNTWHSETGWGSGNWSWFFGGSGGGYSSYESRPSYQSNYFNSGGPKTVSSRILSTNARLNPDVAYDANPNTGFAVYDTVPYSGSAGWFEVGGTSAGAPQWAGLVALADQARGSGNSLDGPTQTMYAVYQMAKTNYSNYFHDITSGNNGYAAGTGYDLVTGLGSPKADQVVTFLTNWTGTGLAGSATPHTTTTTTTSSGKAGHHFTLADATQTDTPQATATQGVTTVTVADAFRGTSATTLQATAATVAGVNGVSDLALLLASIRVTIPATVTPHAPPVATTAVPIAPVRPAAADGTSTRSLTRNYAGSAPSGNDLVGQAQGDQQGQRPAPAPQGAPDVVPDNDDWLGNPDLAGGLRSEAIDARLAGEDGLAAEPAASSLPLLPVMGQERTLNTLALAAAMVFLGSAWKVPARETDSDKDRRRV